MPLTKAYWRILKPFSTKSKLKSRVQTTFVQSCNAKFDLSATFVSVTKLLKTIT